MAAGEVDALAAGNARDVDDHPVKELTVDVGLTSVVVGVEHEEGVVVRGLSGEGDLGRGLGRADQHLVAAVHDGAIGVHQLEREGRRRGERGWNGERMEWVAVRGVGLTVSFLAGAWVTTSGTTWW